MFTLYHSNCLDTACDVLVHLLKTSPLSDPFVQEIILVQSPGMAQWLKLEIAKRQGIAMSIDFPLPASFIWQMFERVLNQVPTENPYQKANLAWTLMKLLPSLLERPQLKQLREYCQRHPTALDCWLLCQNIADLFDQYQVYRPDWLANWEKGKDSIARHLPWQPFLWRTLVAYHDQDAHRAQLFARFFQTLHGETLCNLPERIFVFGIPAMAPQYLQALHALSQQTQVHFFFNNPCQVYWGDLQKHASTDHPLLRAWGKQGAEQLSQLSELTPSEIDIFVEQDTRTLLGKLHHQILHLEHQPPAKQYEILPITAQIDDDDDSVRIHICHSVVRELEVLFDQLLAWFADDTSLTGQDILVMVPDIERYSGAIRAVFGSLPVSDTRFIPFAISDQRLPSAYPLVRTFLTLLQLPHMRCTRTELFDILRLEAVLECFDLDSESLNQLNYWVEHCGIRWGLNQQDMTTWDVPGLEKNTWQWGLERLYAGFACHDDALVDGIRPFDLGEGLQIDKLGALSAFIEAIENTRTELQQARTSEKWAVYLKFLLTQFFAYDSRWEEQIQAITRAIETFECQAQFYASTITYDVVCTCLRQSLEASQTSARFLAGAVNFCTLMPMRAIPFRRVCLLGLNEGDYPRQTTDVSYDLIRQFPRRGDRCRQDDDRYLFLEAIASAREKLHLSYIGRSQQDNQVLEPSVVLGALRDYICIQFTRAQDAQCSIKERQLSMSKLLHVEHDLLPYHPNYFNGEKPTSFMHEWLTTTNNTPSKHSAHPLEKTLELNDWYAYLRLPCRAYLNTQLQVFFQQRNHNSDNNEPFELEHLAEYKLREDLFTAYLYRQEPKQQTSYLLQSGDFPQGLLGQRQATKLHEDMQRFYQEVKPYLGNVSTNIAVDLESNQIHIQGQLENRSTTHFLRYSLSRKPKLTQIFCFWLDYLLYCCMQGHKAQPLAVAAWQIPIYEIDPLKAQKAQDDLRPWLELWQCAQQKPIAFFPQTAWFWLKKQRNCDDLQQLSQQTQLFFEKSTKYNCAESQDPSIQRCFPHWTPEVYAQLKHWVQKLTQPQPLQDLLEHFCR